MKYTYQQNDKRKAYIEKKLQKVKDKPKFFAECWVCKNCYDLLGHIINCRHL